ncbi:c-type cytochrome [Mesorhizobium denitrificans]|uniref:Cytochrome c n=1 Tax=Mesorhizobium denitrificans TaxID=2294114 RepID=A0A371X3L5_9HYPH|nr:cytochrome c [Mesorhizobium denitrificans]RFC63826.1 cytochrome c [Mesorhizobium denitrificans]
MNRIAMAAAALGAAIIGLALAWSWPFGAGDSAPSAATVARGRALYAQQCASCHGAKLEGQPDWKSPLATGRMPAPPHDASGHTWHHPDGVLFRITKEGPAAVVGNGYKSDMPPFGAVMDDGEIEAVLTFIKSTWPERERAYQAGMSRREKEKTQ